MAKPKKTLREQFDESVGVGAMPEGVTLRTKDLEQVMGRLFRVWEGSDPDCIVSDVCNTIAYELLKLDMVGRIKFLENCKRAGGVR